VHAMCTAKLREPEPAGIRRCLPECHMLARRTCGNLRQKRAPSGLTLLRNRHVIPRLRV